MSTSDFALMPLITPERLRNDLHTVFEICPQWATIVGLASPDLAFDENSVVARIGDQQPEQYTFDTTAFAALCELTRFGNSVANNSNHAARERRYLKITYANAARDSSPVSRILVDALPGEIVKAPDDIREMRTSFQQKAGGPKAIKAARLVALQHAEAAAGAFLSWLANSDVINRRLSTKDLLDKWMVLPRKPLGNCTKEQLVRATTLQEALAKGHREFIAEYLTNIRALFALHDEVCRAEVEA